MQRLGGALLLAGAGLVAMVLAGVPMPARAQTVSPTAVQDLSCLGDRSGTGSLNCTANDFTTQTVFTAAPNTPSFCEAGQSFNFSADITLNKGGGGSNYDIGFFAGQSGNSPNNTGGTCSVASFPTSPAPLVDLEGGGDVCGDWNGKASLAARIQNLKVTCSGATTTSSDLSIPYVLSWYPNTNLVCSGPSNITTTIGSKCQSSAATIQTTAGSLIKVGGYVDVTKQTLPDADTQSFTYTATGAASTVVGYQSVVGGVPTGAVTTNNTNTASFSLTDGQTMRVFMDVVTANRTLTIVEQPSGQVTHWQSAASISCAAVPGRGTPTLTPNDASRQIQAILSTSNSAGACTITNTKRARIALVENVVKRMADATSTDQFAMSVTGAGASTLTSSATGAAITNTAAGFSTSGSTLGNFTSATNPTFRATPGQILTLTNTPTAPANYTSILTCTNAYTGPGATTGLPSGLATLSYSLTPAPGDDITCTYTNTAKAKLTLAKVVVNDDGQTKTTADFTLSATGPSPASTVVSGVSGSGTITPAILALGTYTLDETAVPGYVRTSLSCTGAVDTNPADGLALAAGEVVTCTFTNNDQPVGQTITKGWALDVDADGSGTVTVGDTLRYTVTVTNTGAIALTNVQITDAKTTPASKNCASVAPLGTCVLSGTYVVVMADQTAGSVSNVGCVTSTQIPASTCSSPATTTTVVPPSAAALAVTKTADTATFSAGANGSYTLQVANTGGTAVTGTTTVTDTLATGMTFVSGTGTGWSCSAAGQLVTCTSAAGAAAYGNMASITLTVTVGAGMGSSVNNTASVANPNIGGGTPVAGNTATTPILHADLSTSTKTVANLGGGATADVDAGDVLEYTINVIESAGASVTNVHVTDTVQSGLGSVTVTQLPAGATNNSSGGTLDITGISVPASQTVQIKFRVTVGAGFTAGNTIDNTASIDNPAGPDATPGAPTLIYQQSQVPNSGNKILYLHDNLALDRTPQAPITTTGVTIASPGQQDWVLSPVIPAGQSLVLTAGTINVSLKLRTSGSPTVQAFLFDGATQVGASSIQTFSEVAPVSRPFPITLASDYTLLAGHALTLRVVNTATGNKTVTIYEYSSGGSTISFATSTVVHVDSVLAYSAAYSATTTATYYLHGGTVYVRAVGSDPFGGADVGSAEVTITDPNGAVIVSSAAMTAVATASATRTFEYAFAVPTNATLGMWTATVTAHEGTEGTVSHVGAGNFEVRGKVKLGQNWGSGAIAGDTVQLQITGAANASLGTSTAPSAGTQATADATASLLVTLVQSFTSGTAQAYTLGLSCLRDVDGVAVAITGTGQSRTIQMPLDSSVTCTWTDSASVALTIVKLAVVRSDPINNISNPRAIPGSIVEYQIIVTNPGATTIDADSVSIIDPLPGQVGLSVADFAGAGSGPVQFVDGAPSSGLGYTFVSLSSGGDDIEFNGPGGWNYTPTPDVDGIDDQVTGIRVSPKGAFNGNNAQFTLKFRVRVR